MPKRDKTSIVVYHGTWSPKPPHEYRDEHDSPAFHAGTRRSAMDRLDTAEMYAHEAHDGPGAPRPVLHAYEIRTRPSMLTYDDPMDSRDPDYLPELAAPEGDNPEWVPNRIYKYTNRFEDVNKLSYVIPKHFVNESKVKYLGAQFLRNS